MPVRFVSELRSLERFENSVPRLEMAVSWLCNEVNCVFQGVSTFRRLPTIEATVELTSNPVPLVGDPKLSPTVPIAHSALNSSSRRSNGFITRLEKSHGLNTCASSCLPAPYRSIGCGTIFAPAIHRLGNAHL